MAARNRPGLSENTRKRIQTTMLVKRLEDHVAGNVEMPATAVTAALGLLRKTLPDISAVELTGSDGGPIVVQSATPEHDDL